jgi:menaquinone-dependent protoporphyrinogen oxidase
MSVLVAYASSHGSTREIAERIKTRLALILSPTTVECSLIESVPQLSGTQQPYSAIVLGSAIHAGRWISPARNFLRRNGQFLSGVSKTNGAPVNGSPVPVPPVWAFSVGMPTTDKNLETEKASIEKQLKYYLTGETLRGHALFRGVMDPQSLPWIIRVPMSWFVKKEDTLSGDQRDWNLIEAWAQEVGDAIKVGRDDHYVFS